MTEIVAALSRIRKLRERLRVARGETQPNLHRLQTSINDALDALLAAVPSEEEVVALGVWLTAAIARPVAVAPPPAAVPVEGAGPNGEVTVEQAMAVLQRSFAGRSPEITPPTEIGAALEAAARARSGG
jgi:hypothetical protein